MLLRAPALVLLLACPFLGVSPALGAKSAASGGGVPADRKPSALVNPRRVLAEGDYEPGDLPDYASTCGPGQVTQWQKTYCQQDSDGRASMAVVGAFADDSCSGEPIAAVSGDLAAQLAGLNECGPATTSMVSSMGVCDGELLVDQFFQTSDCSGEPIYNATQTQCKSFCVAAAHTPEDIEANMGLCYNMPDQPIEGCVCQAACATCGYYMEDAMELFMPTPPDCGDSCHWPNGPFDCMTCKDGLTKLVLFDDGMGICVPPEAPQCFASPGAAPTENCTCHPSCGSCGYTDDPTSADNCLTCQVGLRLLPRYTDGTGACFPPDMMVVVVNGSDSDSDSNAILEVDLWLAPAEVGQALVWLVLVAGVLSVLGLVVGKMIEKPKPAQGSQEGLPLSQDLPPGYGAATGDEESSTPLFGAPTSSPEDEEHCTY